jgi:hypothetical protein
MLLDPDQRLRNIAVSDRRVHDLEELQIEHGEGACVEAFEDKTLIDTEDLAAEARWPNFSPAAVEGPAGGAGQPDSLQPACDRGRGGVLGQGAPLVARGGAGPGRLHRPGRAHHRQLFQSEERGELATQLQWALDARVVIEQAKGALVAQEGLSEREASERLRRQARSQRRRVVEVAEEVMAAIRHR